MGTYTDVYQESSYHDHFKWFNITSSGIAGRIPSHRHRDDFDDSDLLQLFTSDLINNNTVLTIERSLANQDNQIIHHRIT